MIFQVESNDMISDIKHSKCQPVATETGFLLTIENLSLMLLVDGCKAVLDTKHQSPITALCVSSSATCPYLCSCSDDKVIIWTLNDIRKNNKKTDDIIKKSPGHVVGLDLGAVSDCSINCNNTWLALCRVNDVWIINLEHTKGVLTAVSHHATLEPTDEPSSMCCFSPDLFNLLIIADDSNTFKVWDTKESRLIQRSAVGAWHHISFCEFVTHGLHRGQLLVGTSHGHLHLFSVELNKPPRDLGHVSAAPPVHSTIVITPNHNEMVSKDKTLHLMQLPDDTAAADGPDDGCEAGCIVLGALLVDAHLGPEGATTPGPPDDALRPDEGDPNVDAILAPAPLLVVCSNLGIAVHDRHSWECLAFRSYEELLGEEMALVSAATLSAGPPGRVRCLLSGWSASSRGPGPSTRLVGIRVEAAAPASCRISFLGLTTPGPRSPLRAQFARPACSPYGSKSSPAPSSSRRPAKSSGYGAVQPPRQRFVPLVAAARGRPRPGGAALGAAPTLLRSWVPLAPPLRQSSRVSLWGDCGTAVRLASSGDGLGLACSCGPGVLSVLRWSRPSVEDCVRIAGHDARVTSVCFSADSAWLVRLSASSDGRTKAWDWRGGRRCALDIDGGAEQRRRGAAAPRGQGVAQAAFFYLDKFILRAVAGAVELHVHGLHERDDAARALPEATTGFGSRRVRRFEFPTQQVTCFAAPNNFLSNVLVAGCASRSLHVFDVDAERPLAEVRDAHPRPPHALGLAPASSTAPHCARAADLLVSAAVCDGAKLWDLRQARCVQKFTRHLNRAHACGVSLSPCCRFLAVASEDKCVYIYDTRKSSDYVDKLLGLNEVVLDVVWNANRPQLAASALNSCVALYTN